MSKDGQENPIDVFTVHVFNYITPPIEHFGETANATPHLSQAAPQASKFSQQFDGKISERLQCMKE